jgi:stage II sporulation protein D
VSKTHGEVLIYNNRLVYSMYSSNDGGCSHSFRELFGVNITYLTRTEVGKVCDLKGLKWSYWERFLPRAEVDRFLSSIGVSKGKVKTFEVIRNSCGRGLRIKFFLSDGEVLELPLTFFVRLALYLPSDWFYVRWKNRDGFELVGRGFGHGLGMSQWGAFCLGEKGWNYREILRFFYPHTEVEKLY